jgi:hypothetical protein
VGVTQYVQTSEGCILVYNKTTGATILGPEYVYTLLGTAGCLVGMEVTTTFDRQAQRWVLAGSDETDDCIAVSTTPDVLGPYNIYAFAWPGNLNFAYTYQKLGVWPAQFSGASRGTYLQSFADCAGGDSCDVPGRTYQIYTCAYDRAAMLSGATASQQCFELPSGVKFVLPADMDGSTVPAAGEPGFFMTYDASGDQLDLYELTPNFPSSSTLTGPTQIAVDAFTPYGTNNGVQDIPQPYGPVKLDSFSDQAMYRLAYRTFGAREALVFNHTVTTTTGMAGVRWYEIDSPNGTPTVAQQGTLGADAYNRWMASTAMDQFGDQAIGYSFMGLTPTPVDPGLRIAGRTPSDPAGEMETEIRVVNGGYVAGAPGDGASNYWGPMSAMQVDPIDDCTFWYTGEYQKTKWASGNKGWGTRIVQFRFPSCVPAYAVYLFSGKNPSVQGEEISFEAQAVPNPGATGTVAFTQNNGGTVTTLCAAAPLNANGVALCRTPLLAAGGQTITATYSGGGIGALIQEVSGTQLILNPGFETGDLTDWTACTGGCCPIVSAYKPHTGEYSAAEGATTHTTCAAATAWLKQEVTIPSSATSASLTFWYWPKTDNTSYDTNFYGLALLNSSGTTLQNLLITASNAQTWTTKTFNLNAYIGQAIWIYSAYQNNGSTHGGVYVDDFSLNIQ